MAFKEKYTDLETKDIVTYIKENKIVSWQDLEQQFDAPRGVIKYKLTDRQLFPCLFNKGQYFTLYDLVTDEIDDRGLWKHGDIVFSKFGRIEPTLKALVTQSEAGYTRKELKDMLNIDLHHQLKNLVRNKQLARIKIGYEYFYFSSDDKIREQQIKTRQELNPDLDITPEVSIKKKEYTSVKEIIDVRELRPGDYILKKSSFTNEKREKNERNR